MGEPVFCENTWLLSVCILIFRLNLLITVVVAIVTDLADLLAVVVLHISTMVLVIEQGWEEAALLFLVPSHASKVIIIAMLYMRTGLHVDDFIQNLW